MRFFYLEWSCKKLINAAEASTHIFFITKVEKYFTLHKIIPK